jgi:hypothetical protein
MRAFKALMIVLATAVLLTPASAQTKLTVMVFQGLQNLPLFAAQEKGFFRPARHRGRSEDRAHLGGDAQRSRRRPLPDRARRGRQCGSRWPRSPRADIAVISGGDNGWNQLIVQPDIGGGGRPAPARP